MNVENLELFKLNLNSLIDTPLELITRTKELGTDFDFSSLTENVVIVKKIATRVLLIDFSLLTDEKLDEFSQSFNLLHEGLKWISEFKVDDPNYRYDVIQRRRDLINDCKIRINKFSTLILPYLSLKNDDVNADLNNQKIEAEKIFATIKKIGDNAKLQFDAQSIITSASGINIHSEIFKNQSKTYRNNANIWLGFVIVILICILIFGLFLLNLPVPNSQIEIIYSSVARIIILTSLFYGLNICNKNVKSFRHNSIMNKHRENALMSFQTFTTSTEDQMTKNSILMEATRTIYGIQNTGFADSDKDSDNPIKVIEILKNITKSPSN
jgi:hypothetical protein